MRGSAFVSLLLHVVIALSLVVIARARVHPPDAPVEIEIEVNRDPPPLEREHAPSPRPAFLPPRAAKVAPVIAIKSVLPEVPLDDGIAKNKAPNEITNDNAHECEAEDCVLRDIDRCAAGDGNGCVGVGLYYERGRGDRFSAIKWYLRGCELSSRSACEANERVHGAMPLGWEHHPFYAPGWQTASQ